MKGKYVMNVKNSRPKRRRLIRVIAGGVVSALAAAGAVSIGGQASAANKAGNTAKKIRIGYFANVTHATPLVGVQLKTFEKYFKADKTKVEFVLFNAGPAVIEAMKGGAIDASYIGPNPAISGFVTTNGSLLKILAGATHNGAQLIVSQGISSLQDLKGKKIATPQLGNTQDVAARAHFKANGLSTSITGGGDVVITPTENATTLSLFKSGRLDGGWVPEPWASRLVLEGNGKVLLDEKDIWSGGKFLTTHLIARSEFIKKNPGSIDSLLRAHIEINEFIAKKSNTTRVKNLVQKEIVARTGKPLPQETLDRAWTNISVNNDPLSRVLAKSAEDAVDAGLLTLKSRGLTGIYDLSFLNNILREKNKNFKKYSASRLGRE
jgi:NitT/TauT family transport system substrate-binding protein